MNARSPREGTPMDRVIADAASSGYEVVRALPRDRDRLLVQVRDELGLESAGQWHADPSAARRAAESTIASAGPAWVRQLTPSLFTQTGGADRRLPVLRELVARPGAELVAHRPEKRGVVRHRDPTGAPVFTKVVRRDRHSALVEAHTYAAHARVSFPTVVDADPTAGTLTTGALPGDTLHDVMRARPGKALSEGLAVGRMLATLHAQPLTPGLGTTTHDAHAELTVVDHWLAHAEHHAALTVPARQREDVHRLLTDRLVTGLGVAGPGVAGRHVPVHRDLHDKQIVLTPSGDVALLDPDTGAAGHPALDLANLIVHLELRAKQGLLTELLALEIATSVIEGYAPDDEVRAAFPFYAAATRLRLAAVYAFRPPSREAGWAVLTEPLITGLV